MSRIIPKFNITSMMIQIDDDLESILHFLTCNHIFLWSHGIDYPSQLDIAITVNNIKYLDLSAIENYDDDDDDDEEDMDDSDGISSLKGQYWNIDVKHNCHTNNFYENEWWCTGYTQCKWLSEQYRERKYDG
eukprot:28802_1